MVPIGVFLHGYKKYNQGSGGKEQRTNEQYGYGQLKFKKDKFVTLYSLCLCTQSLTCSFSEMFTKLLGMPSHLDWSSLTAAGLYLMQLVSQMSVVDCPLPLCVNLCQLFSLGSFFQLSDWHSLAYSGHVEISSSGLCLVSRQNRQRDRLLSGPPT